MSRLIRLLGLSALCALPALGQDGGADDGTFLERQIEGLLSGAGRQVIVTGFQGALSSSATLDRMTIADDDGIWLTLTEAELQWNRAALLQGRLQVERLTAAALDIARLPVAQPSGVDLPSVEATPFRLPNLPVSVELGTFGIGTVALGAPLLGEAVTLTVDGSASLIGGEGQARLAVERTDAAAGALTLAGRFENATRALDLDLSLSEPEAGIAARLLNLPGQPSVDLSVSGAGVLSDFTADLRLATAGAERLEGQVQLLSDDTGTAGFEARLGGDLAPMFSPDVAPFFGPEVGLVARGARGADGSLSLDALDLTARALTLSGEVRLAPGGAPALIDVTGRIADPAGGPVRLPSGGGTTLEALDLDIRFDAAAGEDWTAALVLSGVESGGATIDRLGLDGAGVIRTGAGGAAAVTAALTFGAAGVALDDPGAQAALGAAVDGAAEVDWTAGGALRLSALDVTGASFGFTGSGRVAPGDAGPEAVFDGALAAEDLDAFSILAGRSLGGAARLDAALRYGLTSRAFDIRLEGRAEDLSLDQRQFDRAFAGTTDLRIAAKRDASGTRVETLSLVNAAATLSGQADLASEAITAALTLDLPDAARIEPELAGPARLALRAEGGPGDWRLAADVTGIGAALRFDGRFDDLAASPLAAGDLRLEGLDLARLAPLLDRPLGGVLSAAVSGQTQVDLAVFDIAGRLSGSGLSTGLAEADAALAGIASIDLQAARSAGAPAIAVERLAVTSDALSLEARGTVDPGQSQGQLTGAVPELDVFGRGLSGPGRLRASLAEDASGWAVEAALAALGADVTYAGRIAGLDSTPEVAGTAAVRGLDLARLGGLAGRPLSGRVSAEIIGALRADLSAFEVAANAATQDIATGLPEADAALSGAGQLALTARKTGAEALVEVSRFAFSSATVTAAGDGSYAPGAGTLTLTAEAPDLTPFGRGLSGPAQVALRGAEDTAGWAVRAEAAALGATAVVDGRVDDIASGVPLVSGTARLDGLDLARLAGLAGRPLAGRLSAAVEGTAKTDQSQFDVAADVTGAGLALGIAEVDQVLRGTTTVRLAAAKPEAGAPIAIERLALTAPAVRLSAEGLYGGAASALTLAAWLDDIGRFAPDVSGPVTAEGQIGAAAGGLLVDLSAAGPGGLTLGVAGRAARDFQDLDLAIRGRAPLALANTRIAPQSVQGVAEIALALNGPPGLPALAGTVTTQGTRAVLPGPGIVLNDIAATLRLAGGSASVAVTAEKQAGGRLAVRGDVGLTGAQPVDLTVDLAGIVVEDPALYRTVADGQLTLTGALGGRALAAGVVTIGETEIRVPSTGLGTAGPIPDLRHLNEPQAVRTTRSYAGLLGTSSGSSRGDSGGGGGGATLALDVAVVAPNRIFVRGRGLDAELGGRLLLRGTTTDLIPSGQFELIRGRLDILGQRLTLTDGNVTLQGDVQPYIRLVAETEANDVDLFVTLEGPLQSPQITFSSQPELPEDEVLAQLLFGKSLNTISPLQAARLALAVQTLSGRGGESVVGRLRSQFGLSDLDITTTDSGDAALRAGAYLSENVYSDVTVSAAGETEVNLNLDLTPNLTARGSVNTDGETSLGLFFEKDY